MLADEEVVKPSVLRKGAMTRTELAAWLDRYVEAWKTYDRDQIAALFGEGVRYRYHPWDDPVTGRDAVVKDWLDERDDAGTYEGHYEPLSIDGDLAVATGTSIYRDASGKTDAVYHNCFVMRFDDVGRCVEYTEWYMKQP
jgi:hypothetical protein